MEAIAKLTRVRVSPRKVRIILDAIRGQNVDTALAQLKFTPRRGAQIVYKLLESAVANAHVKFGKAQASDLYVSRATADEGPTLRRFRPRARGRASRINKRTSHIIIGVTESE